MFFFSICVCMCLCEFVQVTVGTCRGQKMMLGSLELETDGTVNHLMWVLGAVCTLSHWAIFSSAI